MNIYSEICSLPNFAYFFTDGIGKLHVAILGGHSCETSESYEFLQAIERIHSQMEQLYFTGNLSDEDKSQLAKLMKKMQSFCEKRKVGLHTLSEQQSYIDSLTLEEKTQIEKQVVMYNDCRGFYRDYIYK